MRDAFAAFERANFGRKHPEDISEPLEPELQYIMRWFWELHCGRPIGQSGFLPIPSTEILAWAQLHRTDPRPWELRALRALDSTFLRVMAEP